MNIFDSIIALLKQNENFAVATIVNRSGSAPRDTGTRMLIKKDAQIIGTIGGGILEAKVQRLAADVLANRTPMIHQFALNAEETSNMGMICGGNVRVMIQFMDASAPYPLRLFQAVSHACQTRQKAWLVTPISQSPDWFQIMITDDDRIIAQNSDVPWANFISKTFRPEIIDHNGIEYLVEPLNSDGAVYIFGAGHISQKLAPLTHLVGFHTIVLDDREAFANRKLFPSADDIQVLKAFETAMAPLPIDQDSYLVIVTRGHSHDKTILGQALKTSAGYIGMIGSRRKRNDIYTALKHEGFDDDDFKRIFSPIGLNIGAETPEEIALSIVAELVHQRALKRHQNG